MKKQFAPLLAALATSLMLASCSTETKTETEVVATDMEATMEGDSSRMAKPEGVMVDGVAMTADKDIVDNAAGASSVSTLVSAVKAAGLVETLKGAGPFTVFAPTNAAFDKLPKGAVAGLMEPASKAKLAGVLTYHVIAGRLVAADLKDGQELTTVNGEKLKVTVKDGMVMVGNGKDAPATVQIADVISSNGVTHVIDSVILPPAK
ncbi:fasciclin domain-containing protein [Hymenobacter glacialis]|uniref:Fasciclin n=1 Tax=Hymenobacter glacialis TaxID=1908236 RepID=A0A1G1T5J2_9BACT|nr:fasciclin domain-containing protein [Hymenobacter glacialis]OGX86146.1 fasciclin [Hymenobacter glacialis]